MEKRPKDDYDIQTEELVPPGACFEVLKSYFHIQTYWIRKR